MPQAFDVIVVGGGIAGMVAAWEASAAGRSVLLLESTERLGGAVRGASLAGVTIDVGAESYAITRPDTAALVEQLGLTHLSVAPRRSDSRLVVPTGVFPMPHALLGIPTDPLGEDVIAIVGEQAAARAAALDALPVPEQWDPELTLGSLVRQRLGDAIADLITAPVVGGVHALHPDLAEAEAIIPGLAAAVTGHGGLARAAAAIRAAAGVPGSAVHGLRGGMSTIVSALSSALDVSDVHVRTGMPVLGVEPDASRWSVRTQDAVMSAEQVVIALDARSSASLLRTLPDVHGPLSRMHCGDVIVFAAVIDTSLLDEDPLGSGALIAASVPGLRAKAITHASSKWAWVREAYGPGRHLIRLSYGRDGVIQERLEDLPKIAHADLELLLGTPLPPFVDTHVARWNGSLLHPRVGHLASVAELRAAVAHRPGLALAVSGMAGNGLAGTIGQARASIGRVGN